jgi:DNA-binding response OmpR family regulator
MPRPFVDRRIAGTANEGEQVMTTRYEHTILAVDDLQDNIDLIREIFEDEPYRVLTASTAETALKLARDHVPDLAILDVQMPETDGYELCEILRDTIRTRRIPIIFLTAQHTRTEDAIKGLDIGACDYVTKPFDKEELRARVRSVLRAGREREEDIRATRTITRRLAAGN